jgi:GDP-L-fucose synthase
MKILLTGGTGFVGKNIANYLQGNEYCVSAIGSQNYDLRDSYACKKAIEHYQPDVIVHAAGSVGGIGANQANPGKFMFDNMAMGMNMIESARQYAKKYNKLKSLKFIMMGTVCSYPKFTQIPFLEKDLWDGYPEETNAPYGIAKKALIKLAETYHEQYGLNVVNLIPVNMYGPHDHFNETTSHVIPALILKFANAKNNSDKTVELWGTGQASREFLYVEDCARAIEAAIRNDPGPSPINIGTGREIKIVDLAQIIANKIGYTGEIVFNSSKPDGQPRRCLDTKQAEIFLGFKARVDLNKGLDKTLEYFYEHCILRAGTK